MFTYTLASVILWLGILLLTLVSESPDDKEGKITEWTIQAIAIAMIVWGFYAINA